MSLSYEFSIGSVRVREKSLFNTADYEQMLALKSEEELMGFLENKGYPEGDSVDEILSLQSEMMWKYIRSVAPDMDIFAPFYMQNDIHNFKTILKGVMFGKSYDSLLLIPADIDTDLIRECIENRKFDKLPQWLSPAAEKAYELLAHTKDARLSDGALDRALLETLISSCKKSCSKFLTKYFNTMAFYANIKIAIRASRTKTTMEYLAVSLCECDDFDKDKTVRMIMSGNERLLKYLETVNAYGCKKAIKLYEEKPGLFEKFVDDSLIRIAKEMCRFSIEGPEPLFGYYIGCEYERRAVNMIAGGIRTAAAPDTVRERLRETYG